MAKIIHYASYESNGEIFSGRQNSSTVRAMPSGKTASARLTLVSYKDPNLVLNGLVDVADAQYLEDEIRAGPARIAKRTGRWGWRDAFLSSL